MCNKNNIEDNKISKSTQDNDQETQSEFANINPYTHMRQRLHKSPPQPPKENQELAKNLIKWFNTFSVSTLWLYIFQIFKRSIFNRDSINPFLIISVISGIFITAIIIFRSEHRFEDQTVLTVIFLVLFMFFSSIFIITSFFISISYFYALPLIILPALTLFIIKDGNFNFRYKLFIIVLTIMILFRILFNSII